MTAPLHVLVVVLLSAILGCTATIPPQSTTSTTPTGSTASLYSDCPPSSLEGCDCTDSSVYLLISDDINTCIASLSDSGHTKLSSLSVRGYSNFSLEKDIFKDVQFENIFVNSTTLRHVDENFLGNSMNFTVGIYFDKCTLMEGIPKINGGVLQRLDYTSVSFGPDINPTLRKNTFSGTPLLESLSFVNTYDLRVLTVQRHVFRSLTKLRGVLLRSSVHFRWGAGHFASPDLTFLQFGYYGSYRTFEADPGSFSGIPAGVELHITAGLIIGNWSPSKFFNILREGVLINVQSNFVCGCDLAWIRYSSFMQQVKINCRNSGWSVVPLGEHDLSHCPYYRDQSLHKKEL